MVTITNLARSIDLIARRCPRGLSALAGDAPQPSHDELVAAATWTPAEDVPTIIEALEVFCRENKEEHDAQD